MPLAPTPTPGAPRARSTPRAAALLAIAAWIAPCADATAGLEPSTLRACVSSRHAGTDTTAVGGSRQIGLDRGLSQSFVARDTLVRSISVWLPATSRRLSFPLHLYVTRVGSEGRPDLERVVADAGVQRTGHGQGMQPARFLFEFTPPLSLPETGAYALVLMPDECGIASLLTTAGDSDRDGRLWEVARRGCLEPAASVRGEVTGRDLLYQVEFCDRGTESLGRTWGEIKTQYR